MKFTAGKFEKLRVVRGFHFGPLQKDLSAKTELQFDGTTVKLKGESFRGPELAAAFRAGWLILVSDKREVDIAPKPAGVMVHPAHTVGNERGEGVLMQAASEEERVVGSVEASNARRKDASFNPVTEAPVVVAFSTDSMPLEVTYPGVGNTPPVKKFQTVIDDGAGQGGQMIRTAAKPGATVLGDVESQGDRVSVAKIKTANKQKIVLDGSSTEIDQEISRLDNTPPPKASKVDSDVTPIAKLGSPVKKTVLQGDGSAAIHETAELDNRPPPKAQKFAVKIVEDEQHDVGPVTGRDVARAGDTLEELLPDAASSGVPAPGIAGEGDTEFVWDTKKGYWGNRVKEAVSKYGDNPRILNKIIELEGPKIGAHIRAALGKM